VQRSQGKVSELACHILVSPRLHSSLVEAELAANWIRQSRDLDSIHLSLFDNEQHFHRTHGLVFHPSLDTTNPTASVPGVICVLEVRSDKRGRADIDYT